MVTPKRFPGTVEQVDRYGPDVATYHLVCNGKTPRFRPGQFIHLALETYDPSRHWPESRIFSIASAPSALPRLRLTIARKGRFTSRILDEVEVGRRVWLKGPYGDFVIVSPDPGATIVIIAGGTGITPFCAFMDEMLRGHERLHYPVKVYYGAREPDLLIYRELTDRCKRVLSDFQVCYFLETGTLDGSVPGSLDIRQIIMDQTDPKSCLYYLSGPREMIDTFQSHLGISCGISLDKIFVDAWE